MRNTEKRQTAPADAVCPVSGLPVVRKPEWKAIDLGGGYIVSFEFIGDRMLLSRSQGWEYANRESIKRLFKMRRRVLDQMLAPDEAFVELRDYSHFSGLSSKESRDQFIAEMKKDQARILAFIGFSAPRAVKIGFNVWGRLFRAPFSISIEKDYPAALRMALELLRYPTERSAAAHRQVVKFPEHTYSTDTFSTTYEIINGCIVHACSTGKYSPENVGPSIAHLARVCALADKSGPGCYFINGVSGMELSSYKTRVRYLAEVKRWHADFPHFRSMILYGADRWVKAGVLLSKHMVPFGVKIVKDLESALAYIESLEVEQESPPRIVGQDTPGGSPEPLHEILEYLGNISWGSGKPGLPDPPAEVNTALRSVYDAIALIKMDLDELENERKRAENERQILATAIEQSTDSITITDADGHILYINPAFTRITGYREDEATGRHISFITRDRETVARLNALWQEVTLGRAAKQQITCHQKDGTPYLADTTVSQIISHDGRTRNFVTVQRNVTHEVQLEAQLKQIHKMEAIGTLAGGIAHDFNNILFPIIGYTEMSMDEVPPDSHLAQNLQEILQAATRAKHLVKQILTFSKQDNSSRRPIDLVPVIKEAVSLLRASIPATVEIRQAYQKEIGRVLADPTQIHQVIVNLGSNAFHAMRESGGVLTISLRETVVADDGPRDMNGSHIGLLPGNYLHLSVTDTGHGMPPEISERIFDPFFTTKELATNTGMGLSMIHSIITSHDGRIMVDSEPGTGSTFNVYLPEIRIHPGRATRSGEEISGAVQTGGGHILIVDDEIQSAKIMQKIIGNLGYDTTCFSHSSKALEFFQEQHADIDLVITDLVMPAMTGDTLAAELLKIEPELPVIICTGHREMLNSTDTAQFQEILIKPVSRNDLARAAQRALNDARDRKQGVQP